jgi:hypothetical protein
MSDVAPGGLAKTRSFRFPDNQSLIVCFHGNQFATDLDDAAGARRHRRDRRRRNMRMIQWTQFTLG